MANRCYVVPQNDPNGHGGQVWCTDDAGNFWPSRPGVDPAPGATNPATSPTAPSTSPTPNVNPASGAGAVAGATGGLVDPMAIKALMDLASQSAQQAYLNARLELEKQTAGQQWTAQQEQLAQQAAHDAWTKAIAGREADVQQAATTGYVGGPDVAQRVGDAWNRLPADQKTGANAAAIWQTQVPGLTADEAARVNDAAHQYAAVNGTAMPSDIVNQTLAAVTNGRITGQTATLGREQMQNQTGVQLLQLASQLRGPDNAFAYARTLANVPPEMRSQLDAMMQRSGINYQGPGLGGVVGQLSSGSIGGQAQTGTNAMTYSGAPVGGATMSAQAMPVYQGPGQVQTGTNAAVYQGATPPAAAPAYQTGVIASGAPPAGVSSTGGTMTADIGRPAQATQAGGNYMTYTGPGSPSQNGVQGAPGTPTTSLNTGQTQTGTNAMTYSGNPTGTTGAGTGQVTGLGQIAPQQWNQTNSYVKRLMLAGLEAGGSDKSAEEDAFQQQLPRYQGPRTAAVRV